MTVGGRRYQVQRLLGRGGFGSVYLATMLGAGNFTKTVAIKVLNPEMAGVDEVAARFRDEARVLGLVRHRAIVNVDGLVRLSPATGGADRWGVVMEYIEGINLRTLISRGPVPPAPAVEIIEEVARALHAAWTREGPDGAPLHMIHRDIKPGNIQLTAEGEVKLLDFGIARADFAEREAETRSVMFGSVVYMSPERIEGSLRQKPIDGPESDIYALGAVLLELLTGEAFSRLPLQFADHQQALAREQQRLWQLTGQISGALVQLVADMLHHSPAARPTARQVAQQAEEIVRQIGGSRLRSWAEGTLPPLITAETDRQKQAEADDISSAVLIEQTSTIMGILDPPPPSLQPRPPLFPRWLLAASAAAFATGFVVFAAVSIPHLLPDPDPDPDPAPAPSESSPAPAPADPTPPPPIATPRTEPPPPPAPPVTDASPPPWTREIRAKEEPTPVVLEPEPVVLEPEPEVRQEPPREVVSQILVSGDARSVSFRGDGGTFSPGRMPPGAYQIQAVFVEQPVQAGRITLLEGQTLQIRCTSSFQVCK